MSPLLTHPAALFDALEGRWQAVRTQRAMGTAVAAGFVLALALIGLRYLSWLPAPLAQRISPNPFGAIYFAFTLLLVVEVLGLVFALARSVADSVGKQFELLSLILLREAFLEFAHFVEPIDWQAVAHSVLHMVADMAGALVVFVGVGFFYRVQRHQAITADKLERASFVATKKLIALGLLAIFLGLGAVDLAATLGGGQPFPFFEAFYLVLIFTDILIVLVSLRYSPSFHVVFRNSGFAAATVMIRLALTAPPYVNVSLALGAVLFALGMSTAYNAFAPVIAAQKQP